MKTIYQITQVKGAAMNENSELKNEQIKQDESVKKDEGVTIGEFKKLIKPKLKILTKNQLIDIINELAYKMDAQK